MVLGLKGGVKMRRIPSITGHPLRWFLRILSWGMAGGMLFAVAVSFAEDRMLVVDKFVFTNDVRTNKEFDQKYGKSAPVSPIVLWTRIVGTQKALERMRAEGRLPIKHMWYHSCGSKVYADPEPVLVDEIDLDVGGLEQILDELQLEVNKRTYFDWRTWSRKEHVSNCWYQVLVVDNRNDPLYCTEIKGDCRLDITLEE
jgi:hypothetical protein